MELEGLMVAKWCSDCRIEYDEAKCPRCVDKGSIPVFRKNLCCPIEESKPIVKAEDTSCLEVAKVLLAGMCSNTAYYDRQTREKMVAVSIELTDSLLAALKELK